MVPAAGLEPVFWPFLDFVKTAYDCAQSDKYK